MGNSNKLELVVTVDNKQANANLGSINKNLSNLEQTAAKTTIRASQSFDGMTASMAKGVVAGNALYDMAKKAFEMLKNFTLGAIETQASIGKMAEKLGLSVKEMSAYSHVAYMAGLDVETLGTSVGILSKNMLAAAQGASAQKDKFQLLHVAVQNSDKTLRSTASVLTDLADRFHDMPNGATKTALAMQLFGRSGKEIIPLLNKGSEGIRDYIREAEQFGLVIGDDSSKAAREFGKNVKELKSALEGLAFRLSQELLPLLLDFTHRAVEWVKNGGIDKAASYVRELAEWVKNLGMWLVSYSVISGILKAASAVKTLTTALGALDVAMLANPWGLAAAGIATFGYVLWREYDKIKASTAELKGMNEQYAIMAAFKAGKTVDEIKKITGATDEQVKYAIAGPGSNVQFGATNNQLRFSFKTIKGMGLDYTAPGPETGDIPIEDEGRAEKIAKFITDATRSAREFLQSTRETLLGGAGKEIMEISQEIHKLTTYVDAEGAEEKVKLTAEARAAIEQLLQARIRDMQDNTAKYQIRDYYGAAKEIEKLAGVSEAAKGEARLNIQAATELKIRQLQKDSTKEAMKGAEELGARMLAIQTDLFRKKLDYESQLVDKQLENANQLLSFQEERAGYQRDAALRQIDFDQARTAGGDPNRQAAFEARRAEVEIQYARQVHDVKAALFDAETEQIITQLDIQKEVLATAGANIDQISASIEEIRAQREKLRGQIDEQTQAAIDTAKDNAAVRQMEMVRDRQQKMFDSLKDSASGVMDALLTKSQSVASAIGNAFKVAILTAIKEIVSSQVARALMQLFGGGPAYGGGGMAGAGGGGGILGPVGGMIPMLGGGGGGGGMLGGGTAGAGGSGGGGLFSVAGLAGLGGNLKNFLGFGPLAGGAHLQSLISGQGAGLMGNLSKLGHSNAALMGGATLAMMGLQRGGVSGLAMTAAGGALIGFKYGGPLGAAIGGIAGGIAGTIRLFIKGATEKVRQKVKATYGVDISDKNVLKQIADMAKQSFGGNIDMAINSQQVRDLVELYAMTTGQKTSGMPGKMMAATFVQGGGSLTQAATYENGQVVGGSLPGASLDKVGAGAASSAGPTVINVTIPGAKEFFEKETVKVVVNNPRAVQKSATAATRASVGRRELAALTLAPGTITS